MVNADDFGRSRSINEAVLRAHQEGILTTASLMVAGEAFEEAVALAQERPTLGVGLHLTLVCGRSVLPAAELPGLVTPDSRFDAQVVRAGFRYFADPRLREPLRREIAAQFARFRETGLVLDHVNGHLHLHLHPTVFGILCRDAPAFALRQVRLTREPLGLNLRLARGRWLHRVSHALVFALLARHARPRCAALGWRHTDRVFGLLQNGRMDESYVRRLLTHLPPGDSELYSHPSLDEFRHELEALVSPRVRAVVAENRIRLVRYQDLERVSAEGVDPRGEISP